MHFHSHYLTGLAACTPSYFLFRVSLLLWQYWEAQEQNRRARWEEAREACRPTAHAFRLIVRFRQPRPNPKRSFQGHTHIQRFLTCFETGSAPALACDSKAIARARFAVGFAHASLELEILLHRPLPRAAFPARAAPERCAQSCTAACASEPATCAQSFSRKQARLPSRQSQANHFDPRKPAWFEMTQPPRGRSHLSQRLVPPEPAPGPT